MLETLKKIFGIKPSPNFKDLVQNGAVIIDVRTKQEFAQGHIKGSQNIELKSLSQHLKSLKAKNKPIITCCASGMRSASAKSFLLQNGISVVYNGGGWYGLNQKLK